MENGFMFPVLAADVKALRDATGAGIEQTRKILHMRKLRDELAKPDCSMEDIRAVLHDVIRWLER